MNIKVNPPKFKVSSTKLLLVDDDAILLRSLRRILEDEFQINTATSASEAMICLMQDKYDGIICDYKMTGQNGKELLRKVAQEYPNMFRVLLTGEVDNSDSLTISQRDRVDRILHKPIEPEMLVSEIRALSKNRSSITQRLFSMLIR